MSFFSRRALYTVAIDTSLPTSRFGAASTAEEVTADIDLAGKTAVVTGCNSGIGMETLRVLALRGAHVIGTGRTLEVAQKACASVPGKTTPVALELSDFNSIIECAQTIAALDKPIDMLICNAGVIHTDFQRVNGMDRTPAINHLGHFLFASRLRQAMERAEQARIVMVSSRSAWRNVPPEGIDFESVLGEKECSVLQIYGQSKLANALFSRELTNRWGPTSITCNAVHPGVINTKLFREGGWLVRNGFSLFANAMGKNIQQGAATSCYAGTNPALLNVTGAFFFDCNPITVSGSHHLQNDALASKLWDLSEKLTAEYL
jgi:NAD(P)-dependent dehydrogenase (short-subunit alcohol dehydrogenase family)